MTRMTKKTEMRFEKIQKSRTGSIQIRKCPRVSNIVYVIFDDACELTFFFFFKKTPPLFASPLRACHAPAVSVYGSWRPGSGVPFKSKASR